jgi:hypothetical protein
MERRNKRLIVLTLIFAFSLLFSIGLLTTMQMLNLKDVKEKEAIKKEISSHYNELVKTNKDAKIYIYENGKYDEVGTIYNDEIISLEDMEIKYNTTKFHIKDLEGKYYIDYQDVEPVEEKREYDERYKEYILFNENVITSNVSKFYDLNDKLIYSINESLSLPILIKYDDSYGVIYNDRLLMIKKEDVSNIVESENTNVIPTKNIAVLNYHFFYDESIPEDVKECNQRICHPKSQVLSHIKYIKDNNILTLSMNEFEMWMDKRINLPKSTLVTIDDGWRMYIGIDLFEENEINATVFLITSWFKEIKFLHDYKYIEFHSHGDNLHNSGKCQGGRGGLIKCLEKSKLLDDLALSRKKLDGSTAFCFPFYDYNDYAINALREAGFTMAFIGGQRKASQDDYKFKIPRYEIFRTDKIEKFKNYIG